MLIEKECVKLLLEEIYTQLQPIRARSASKSLHMKQVLSSPAISSFSDEQIANAYAFLLEKRYIELKKAESSNMLSSPRCDLQPVTESQKEIRHQRIMRVTARGCHFLDTCSDPALWGKIKAAGTSLDVVARMVAAGKTVSEVLAAII